MSATLDHSCTVTTQAELDQALSDGVKFIDIRSEPSVWLEVEDTGSSIVRAWDHSAITVCGSASVVASDYSTVEAWDSSIVRASGRAKVKASNYASVMASGFSTVEAEDHARVEATDHAKVMAEELSTIWAKGTTTVQAMDSTSVTASGFASVVAAHRSYITALDCAKVTASGYTTVEARGASTVTAWGSSIIRAEDHSSIKAWGSTTVQAWGFTSATASSHVTVHQHSRRVSISGGIVIDHTQEPLDPLEWCAWNDVPVTEGKVILHKAVGDDWTTGENLFYEYHPIYSPGSMLEAPDWSDDNECGGGLHFSPRTWEAQTYHPAATRFVAVEVDVADVRPILGATPKAKAPRCRVLYEVSLDGNPLSE